MAHPRPFRFGIQLHVASTAAEWADLAREAEDLGFSTLFVPDHFGEQLAPGPALTAAADATSTLRVGTLVLDNDYKHPVVTAKEMATIDLLSSGRLELGIGAGWMASDYEQSGIPMDDAATRVSKLEEGIAVLKGLFAPGPFTWSGTHYQVTDLDGLPRPVQSPHPPFLVGGGGPRVLELAGREADIVGVNPAIRSGRIDAAAAQDGVAELTDRKVGWVKAAAGERYADIEMQMLMYGLRDHRRPRRHARDDGSAVRADPRRAGRLSVRVDRPRRRRRRGPAGTAGAVGHVLPRRAGPRRHAGRGADRRPPGRDLTPWATRPPPPRPRSGSPVPAG